MGSNLLSLGVIALAKSGVKHSYGVHHEEPAWSMLQLSVFKYIASSLRFQPAVCCAPVYSCSIHTIRMSLCPAIDDMQLIDTFHHVPSCSTKP